jgi:hypothetical protein
LTNSTFYANRVSGGNGGEGGQGGSLGFGGKGGDGGDGGRAAGGGIAATDGAVLIVVHSTLAKNTVMGGEGAIGGNAGTEVTRHGRAGSTGAAVGANLARDGGEVRLANNLFAHGSGADNSAGTVVDLGHNLSSDSTPAFEHPASRNDLEPLLGRFANHGGPTPTVALQVGSPAVDAAAPGMAPTLDQRGFVRVGPPDVGAYELGGSLPGLAIQLLPDAVMVSWPIALTGYRLQVSPSVTQPVWVDAPLPEVDDFRNVVTLPIDAIRRFYRLTR